MDRIAAADNLTIEIDDARWRLIANGADAPHVMVEAQPGQPLRYYTSFGASRRLPDTGALMADDIQRVVLGWSEQDYAWHLGLLLEAPLAQQRGSRWCEIARWPDPDTTRHADSAARAGEALASIVERPFAHIPPQPAAVPVSPAAPPAPPRPLPAPPLELDSWTLERTGSGCQLVRDPAVARGLVRRSLWYTLWIAVYIVLVITNFTSGIAPARPEFLPYLGVLSAVILAGLVIRNVYWLSVKPDRIVFDAAARTVTALRGQRERWRFDASALAGVIVSQVAEKGRRKQSLFTYGALNLQLTDGRFWFMLDMTQIEPLHEADADAPAPAEAMTVLSAGEVRTALQAAGMHIAEALGVTCWYDHRTR